MIIAFPRFRLPAALLLTVALAVSGAVCAQTPAADTVLISNSVAKVTRAEYDAELKKLPADLRGGFANNPRRVNDLLMRMLVQKSLAVQAKAAKLDATPDAQANVFFALLTEQLIACAMNVGGRFGASM